MATIAENEANMTLCYYKSDGSLANFSTGIIGMENFYPEHLEDMKLIIDLIVLPKDDYVLKNFTMFKINTATNPVTLEMKPQTVINKYTIATS